MGLWLFYPTWSKTNQPRSTASLNATGTHYLPSLPCSKLVSYVCPKLTSYARPKLRHLLHNLIPILQLGPLLKPNHPYAHYLHFHLENSSSSFSWNSFLHCGPHLLRRPPLHHVSVWVEGEYIFQRYNVKILWSQPLSLIDQHVLLE